MTQNSTSHSASDDRMIWRGRFHTHTVTHATFTVVSLRSPQEREDITHGAYKKKDLGCGGPRSHCWALLYPVEPVALSVVLLQHHAQQQTRW